jgi:choline dehydrogenase-like flavoprotein
MLPEKDGGVVKPKIKVYGVQNLRVTDARIFPVHLRNNIQTAVYAVAEKGKKVLDMILSLNVSLGSG